VVRIRRSRHAAPVAVILALFAASRVWAWEEGVRFDKSPLAQQGYEQYLDPGLLKHHLLQSIWYLHSQPPLYNLLVGIDLKIFGGGFATAAQVAQIGLGIGIAVALYTLCVVLGTPRWWAVTVSALFAVSPAMIVYENWLFYEYAVAALLLFSALAFVALERRPSVWRSGLLFGLLVAICLIRASFQILLPLIVLAFALWLIGEHRREILVGAALPIMILAALSVKNWVVFGTPSTSSWLGMNLVQVDQYGWSASEAVTLRSRGIIGPISEIRVFQPLAAYKSVVQPSNKYASIPALHDQVKPGAGDTPNFNNITYVTISNKYMHDWLQILLHKPSIYLRGILQGMRRTTWPSTEYGEVIPNRSKIEPWVRGFDAVVLWQPHVTWERNRPQGTAYGIVIFYLTALLFGAGETLRVLRRRGGSATIAFLWILLAYATLTLTFAEVSENQRIRFVSDPIVTILVSVAAARLLRALWHRRHRPPASNGNELRTA
jgi:4-amino-4-deoxy-L-arabinose transferase-like glycosyltransferase